MNRSCNSYSLDVTRRGPLIAALLLNLCQFPFTSSRRDTDRDTTETTRQAQQNRLNETRSPSQTQETHSLHQAPSRTATAPPQHPPPIFQPLPNPTAQHPHHHRSRLQQHALPPHRSEARRPHHTLRRRQRHRRALAQRARHGLVPCWLHPAEPAGLVGPVFVGFLGAGGADEAGCRAWVGVYEEGGGDVGFGGCV